YFLMPVRAWKATAPDLTGHRPQIAGNRNADRIARPSPLPVYSHVSGVSLDIENYCTVSLFFEQTYL
ncbi:hypothetical protein, partial [Klebsiella pneumoniae]|uniref:hypothetical protein n=1 Tax=Klebsiella pneumoniae TaxID=573 RepID=UPI0025A60ED8